MWLRRETTQVRAWATNSSLWSKFKNLCELWTGCKKKKSEACDITTLACASIINRKILLSISPRQTWVVVNFIWHTRYGYIMRVLSYAFKDFRANFQSATHWGFHCSSYLEISIILLEIQASNSMPGVFNFVNSSLHNVSYQAVTLRDQYNIIDER